MVAMPERTIDSRRVGRTIAIVAGVAVAGVVIYFAARGTAPSSSSRGARSAAGPTDQTSDAGAVPVTDVTAVGLQGSGKARVQLTDRRDRSRVVGLLEFDALDPLPDGRARIRSPRQLVFLRDGRVVELRAATATIVRQAQSAEPESGVFSGGVEIRLLGVAPGASSSPAVDPASGPVELQARTSEVRFDRALSELTARAEFSVNSPTLTLQGRGLRLVWNDPESRPELVVIDQADLCRITPGAKSPGAKVNQGSAPLAPATADARPAPAERPTPAPPTAPTGRRIAYRAEVGERLTVTTAGRRLESSSADVLFTLVDNTFPQAELARPGNSTAPGITPPASAAGGATNLASTAPGADSIELAWSGRLVIRPVAGATGSSDPVPSQLAADPAWAQFRGQPDRPVVVTDQRSGAKATADLLTYAAGRGIVTLQGADHSPARLQARHADPNAGQLLAQVLEADLRAGRVYARGPGIVFTGADASDFNTHVLGPTIAGRSVSWDTSAQFTFDAPDGWMGQRLQSATFTGAVNARDPVNLVRGSSLTATMADGPGRPRLANIAIADADVLAGRVPGATAGALTTAMASTATLPGATQPGAESTFGVGQLRARQLDVRFAPVPESWPGEAPPQLIDATGTVRVSLRGPDSDPSTSVIDAARLTVTLKAPPTSATAPTATPWEPIVETVAATGSAGTPLELSSTSGRPTADTTAFSARGDSLDIDVGPRVARLRGSLENPAQIRRGGVWLTAPRIVANGQLRDLDATGPGLMRLTPGGSANPGKAEVTWSRSLTVNDAKGTARADGGVRVVSTPSDRQTDTLVGERVDLAFTPAAPATEPAPSAPSAPRPERQLLRAEVLGAAAVPADERDPPAAQPAGSPAPAPAPLAKATAESRRFAATPRPDGSRPVESLVYLEGDRIIASQSEGWLEVPGPGRALVDQRGPSQTPAATPTPGAPTGIESLLGPAVAPGADAAASQRGTSLFSWRGGLKFDQTAGVLTLTENVRLIHRPADGPATTPDAAPADPTVLDAATLRAELDLQPPSTPGAPPASSKLRSVTATGNGDRAATLRHRGSRVSATELRYDPLASLVDARADEPARVVLEMPGRPEPVSAQRVTWSLKDNAVRIDRPSATVAPR